MKPGTILCDDEFRFSDGSTGKKILIILNDGDPGFYIVVKTTSQGDYKGNTYGCQTRDRYPNFFLPKGCCCLSENTWIQLDQYFEFTKPELVARHFSGKINRIGLLPNEITLQLLECAINSFDITGTQEKILKEISDKIKYDETD
jgi:hypothetical protein